MNRPSLTGSVDDNATGNDDPAPATESLSDVGLSQMFTSLGSSTASKHDVEQSCIALFCLTASGPSPQLNHDVQHGGLASVSSVMSSRLNDPDIQRALTGVLWNLAADPSLHVALVTSASGKGPSVLEKALASMDAHPVSTVVQEQGCGFLWSLLSNPDTRLYLDAVTVSACLTRVLRAMQLHADAPSVQESACAALCNLLSCDHVDVTQLGYRNVRAVPTSPSAPTATGTGVGARGAVGDVVANNDICSVALALGTMARVLACMDGHREHAGVQEKACLALWSLLTAVDPTAAVHPAGKEAAVKGGAMGRVVSIRQRFAGNAAVAAAADGALALLLAK